MSLSFEDFQQRVGQKLGIVRASEPLSAEDAELIASAYRSLWAQLEEKELADWDEDEDLPDRVSEIVVGMTAAMLVDEFGMEEPRRTAMVAQHSFGLAVPTPAERQLRRLMAVPTSGDVQELEYF